ncbi:MAG: carboxymuconolactone decarboxylase family protein [Bradyrhizobium sp.]
MKRLHIQTIESASEKSRPCPQGLENKFGFIPDLTATMAESPVPINAFVGGFSSFDGGSFSEGEKQVLLLTGAVMLRSPWTVALHSTMALQEGVSGNDVDAIHRGRLPKDPKYAALAALARALIEKRGHVTDAEVETFTSAGYSEIQVLEVIYGIGISTMAATLGNLAGTSIDDRLKAQACAAARK